MDPILAQRVNNVIRMASTQGWDLASQSLRDRDVLLRFTPAGQLSDPAVLPQAMTQLGYALTPFLARLVSYESPKEGGPAVTYLVPDAPAIVRPVQ